MTASRHNISGRRLPGLIECGLVLIVIVGLGFVSLRILNNGLPTAASQTLGGEISAERADAISAARQGPTPKSQ